MADSFGVSGINIILGMHVKVCPGTAEDSLDIVFVLFPVFFTYLAVNQFPVIGCGCCNVERAFLSTFDLETDYAGFS